MVDQTAKELDLFAPGGTKVKTIAGEECTVGAVTWGKEIQIMKSVKLVLANLREVVPDMTNASGSTILKIIEVALEVAPEQMTKICATLLDKDPQWISDNLDGDAVYGLVVPFFKWKKQSLLGLLAKTGLKLPPAVSSRMSLHT